MNPRILAAPALALLVGACTVDNNASLAWGPICFPTDDCTFDATCGAQYIGPYEVSATAGSLVLVVQMNNQRADTTNEGTGNVNTATAYIRGLEIEYSNGLPTTLMPVSYQVPATGSSVFVVQIPLPSVALGQRVTARVRAQGVYGDETEFDTAALEIPIDVCDPATTCLYARACAAGTGCPTDGPQSPIVCATP